MFLAKPASEVPRGFAAVCEANGWDVAATWGKLGGGDTWYGAPNGAYMYFNLADGLWWLDEPGGGGVYTAAGLDGRRRAPPAAAAWKLLGGATVPPPRAVVVHR